MVDPEVEKSFDDFWRAIVCRPDGSLDVDQVKKELYDFAVLLEGASTVYDHVTGGRISKPLTQAHCVIEAADQVKREEIDAAIADATEENA